jgi:hypothetical protein
VTSVALVGGSTAANVNAATVTANAATNANTASTIVKRDASGNFSAGTITANLAGNATSASTVTNGVVTTGSYADPSWITSLAGAKITGTVANATSAVNASTVTNGVVTTGSYADPAWITSLAASKLTGSLGVSLMPALTGDVTSTAGTTTTALAVSGVTAGTYPKVTVDTKGRVTAGSTSISLTTDVAGALPIANGGTGSNTKNFVDLSTSQAVAGTKTFSGVVDASAATNTMPIHVSSTFPATCSAQAEMLIKTGAVTAGQQVYLCNSAGTGWNLIGDGLGNNNNLSFNPILVAANSVNLVKNTCTSAYTGSYPTFAPSQDIPIPPASGSLSSTSTLVASVLSSVANAMPSAWDSYTFQAYVDNSGTKSFLHVCNLTLTSFSSSGSITFNVRAIN